MHTRNGPWLLGLQRIKDVCEYQTAMRKLDNDHAERELIAEVDSEVEWAHIRAEAHSDKLLSAAAARWQTRLACARNSHEEQEAHRAMNAYARSKGWEAKWTDSSPLTVAEQY